MKIIGNPVKGIQKIVSRESKEWKDTFTQIRDSVQKQTFTEELKEGFKEEISPDAIAKNEQLLSGFHSLLWVLLPISLLFFVYGFVWFASVSGNSMLPTYTSGEIVVIDKRTQTYEYGDVLIFRNYDGKNLIKRIVGKSGDTIYAKNGTVYRNGIILEEAYTGSETADFEPVEVEKDSYFLLGDNRNDSVDSRTFGCVAETQIIGRVEE